MAILKTFKNARRAWVKSPSPRQARSRLKNRYCVSVELKPNERKRSAVRGVRLALREMHGCHTSKQEAFRAAERLSKKARL